MPKGYVDAKDRVFTKLLKPPLCYLKEQRYSSVVYVDDSLLAGDTYAERNGNMLAILECLHYLGFRSHHIKSSFIS